jgi:uncharacterized repeat protein (TIGR01451 family)
VTVVDTLPAGVSFVSATATQGSCQASGNRVTCNLGTLASGAIADMTITVSVGSSHSGPIVNTAQVTLNESDPNLTNNTDSEGTLVASNKSTVDLQVSIVDAPDPAIPGAALEYVNVVSNVGGLPATGVMLTDILPEGASFVSAVSTQGSCTESGGQVTCNIGALAPASSVQVTIRLSVEPTSLGTLINTASVEGNEEEVFVSNNWDDEGTAVFPTADLAVVSTSTPNPVLQTKDLTYSLDIQNNGPSPATGVVVSETLPVSAVFISATPSQGTCAFATGVVTCSIGNLPANGTATVGIQITVAGGFVGTYTGTATVSGNEYDPCVINDTHVEVTSVRGYFYMPIIQTSYECPFCLKP